MKGLNDTIKNIVGAYTYGDPCLGWPSLERRKHGSVLTQLELFAAGKQDLFPAPEIISDLLFEELIQDDWLKMVAQQGMQSLINYDKQSIEAKIFAELAELEAKITKEILPLFHTCISLIQKKGYSQEATRLIEDSFRAKENELQRRLTDLHHNIRNHFT